MSSYQAHTAWFGATLLGAVVLAVVSASSPLWAVADFLPLLSAGQESSWHEAASDGVCLLQLTASLEREAHSTMLGDIRGHRRRRQRSSLTLLSRRRATAQDSHADSYSPPSRSISRRRRHSSKTLKAATRKEASSRGQSDSLELPPSRSISRRRRHSSKTSKAAKREETSSRGHSESLDAPAEARTATVPDMRSVGRETEDDGVSNYRGIVLNHLAKCGGTLVKWAINRSVPGAQIITRNEVHELTKNDTREGGFIIGLIRNPFDYYVSLWAYTAEHADGKYFRQALEPHEQAKFYPNRELGHAYGDKPSDVIAFRQWLRAVSDSDVGLLTMRFYGHYLDQEKSSNLQQSVWNTETAAHVLLGHPHLREKILHGIASFSTANSPVTCWVHSDDIESSTRTCLTRYEAEAGGVVDWAAFNSSVPFSVFNRSPHRPCSIFYDEESRALVARLDSGIFRAFGYPPHLPDDLTPNQIP